MQLTLAVDIGDGPVHVTTNLFVIVQYERKFKRKASEMATAVGMEDLLFLAWEACKLHGVVVPAAFDDFIRRAVSVEIVDQDNDPNPTHGSPTDTP